MCQHVAVQDEHKVRPRQEQRPVRGYEVRVSIEGRPSEVSFGSASRCHSTSTAFSQAVYGALWLPGISPRTTPCVQDWSKEKCAILVMLHLAMRLSTMAGARKCS